MNLNYDIITKLSNCSTIVTGNNVDKKKQNKNALGTPYITGASNIQDGHLVFDTYVENGEFGAFGQALESLKRGKLVTRKGWNGKGMFIFMRPADEILVDVVVDNIKSLPQSLKEYYRQDMFTAGGTPIQITSGGMVKFTAYICMKAADGSIVNGWLASQTDMLSEDYRKIKKPLISRRIQKAGGTANISIIRDIWLTIKGIC